MEYSKSGGSNYVNNNSSGGKSRANKDNSKSEGNSNNNGSGCARARAALEGAESTARSSRKLRATR